MRSVAIICVRALAAYVIVLNLSTFSTIAATQLMVGNIRAIAWPPIVTPFAFMVLGAVMLAFSKSVAGMLTRGVSEASLPPLDARELLQLGTALLGLFFLASAVPTLLEAAWIYFGPDLSAGDRFRDVAQRVQRAALSLTRATGYAATGAVLLWMARGLFARSAPAK